MNRSYSKIRHIQESNLILEQRIIMEQSDVWNSIKPIGNNPNGPKEIKTNIPASTALTIEGKETKVMLGGKKYIPYVGAYIQSQYDESTTIASLAKAQSVTALSSRFGSIVKLFISFEKNAIKRAGGSGQASYSNNVELFDIQIFQNRSGKFQLTPQNQIILNPNWMDVTVAFSVTNGGRYKTKMAVDAIAQNLSMCLGDTYTKINDELSRLGFQLLPNSINLTTSVII